MTGNGRKSACQPTHLLHLSVLGVLGHSCFYFFSFSLHLKSLPVRSNYNLFDTAMVRISAMYTLTTYDGHTKVWGKNASGQSLLSQMKSIDTLFFPLFAPFAISKPVVLTQEGTHTNTKIITAEMQNIPIGCLVLCHT
jgi:hypothetical protein